MRRILLPLIAIALSGCLSSPGTPPVPDGGLGRDGPGTLLKGADGIAAPTPSWSVGMRWDHEWVLHPGDAPTVRPVAVVAEGPDAWQLAAVDEPTAALAASWGLPTVGNASRDNLTLRSPFGAWGLYAFPLHDGKTWNASVPLPGAASAVRLDFFASFDPAIPTFDGPAPGFRIVGAVGDTVLLQTDYIPSLGWFSQLDAFVPDRPEAPFWSVRTVAFVEENPDGAYLGSAAEIVRVGNWVVPLDGTAYYEPVTPFRVPSGATHVFGNIYAVADAGASHLAVVEPDGRRHEVAATSTGDAQEAKVLLLDAVPGTWHVAQAGGGHATGGGALLFAVTLTPMPA